MRVQCATLNGHLGGQGGGFGSDVFASWLNPTLDTHSNSSSSDSIAPPDIVAVGFQEMIPLHLALAGFAKTTLDVHEDEIKSTIEQSTAPPPNDDDDDRATTLGRRRRQRVTYSLVARESIGGIALLVYSNDSTVTDRIERGSIETATVGCGVLNLMGNKGAVAVRFNLVESEQEQQRDSSDDKDDKDGGGDTTSYTFVSAHLAAHQNKVERRNRDWREIVERLVFARDDDGRGGVERDLYETNSLFVFGVELFFFFLSSLFSPSTDA